MTQASLTHIFAPLRSHVMTLAKGDYLFHQGDAVVSFFYVTTGKIKLIRETVEGGQVLIYGALAGETLAEASLFSDVYHCAAIADAPSSLMVYPKAELLAHLESNPQAMMYVLNMFAQQVRDLRSINEIKNIRSAQARVLAYIRYAMNADGEVHLHTSLKDMAYKIGLTHETYYRTLKTLEDKHMLVRKDGCIQLL